MLLELQVGVFFIDHVRQVGTIAMGLDVLHLGTFVSGFRMLCKRGRMCRIAPSGKLFQHVGHMMLMKSRWESLRIVCWL